MASYFQSVRTELAAKSKPTIVVAPIGTFSSVIAFLGRSKSLLPNTVYQCALLDKDVHDEYVMPLKRVGNHAELTKVQEVADKIQFLPWTPEVGICEFLRLEEREAEIREYFGDARISLDPIAFSTIENLTGGALRKRAKELVRELIKEIADVTLKSQERVRQDISDYFSKACLTGPDGPKIKQLLMPIINA